MARFAREETRRALLYASEWSDSESAALFFEAYQKAIRGKSKQMSIKCAEANHCTGETERGYFRLTRTGTRVTAEENLPEAEN